MFITTSNCKRNDKLPTAAKPIAVPVSKNRTNWKKTSAKVQGCYQCNHSIASQELEKVARTRLGPRMAMIALVGGILGHSRVEPSRHFGRR